MSERYPTKIREGLFLGDSIHGSSPDILTSLNITSIINISQESYEDRLSDIKVTVRHINIQDHPKEKIEDYFSETTAIIKKSLDEGSNILVHCGQGVSRSTTIVLAYLLTQEKMTFRDAAIDVRSKRPMVNPNNAFMRKLVALEKSLTGKTTVDESLFTDDWGSGMLYIR
mmetsp:Transcript_6927/g.7597  ORF Transcript_6927/g.7597 Transcript_6927/m.7597 type:complete len:170 (-) Transcript_6927:123-632(-)